MIAKSPTAADPRGMEQRFLSALVFQQMLKKSIEGVDRDLLGKAILAGLKNQDGRARGAIGSVYVKFSYEEIKPLLPAIYEAIVTPAPSGIMFADGVRLSGLDLLAKNHIKEGLPLCLSLMDLDRWGAGRRIPQCIDSLARYGGAAKPLLPQLRQIEKDFMTGPRAKTLQPHLTKLQAVMKDIETDNAPVGLLNLK